MDETLRRTLAKTMMEPSALEDVARAIAAFAKLSSCRVYIERRESGYRWSPAHKGGPYPILREVARFLDLDYHNLVVGCAAVAGWSVVAPEGPRMLKASASKFIDPDTDAHVVANALVGLGAAAAPVASLTARRPRG